MKKFVLPLTLLVFGLLPGFLIVHAQEVSPFDSLVQENGVIRSTMTYSDNTLADYQKYKDDYEKLNESYLVAYGTQKVALANRVLAKGQDALLAKLGTYEAEYETIVADVEALDLAGDDDLAVLKTDLENFRTSAASAEELVNNLEALGDINAAIISVNNLLISHNTYVDYYGALVSIQHGRYLIEQLTSHSDLIQTHMSAASGLGGDITGITRDFDAAMLELEQTDAAYVVQAGLLSGVSPESSLVYEVASKVDALGTTVSEDYEILSGVVSSLSVLYARSPWTINTEQFME